jgi:hypothetical protein
LVDIALVALPGEICFISLQSCLTAADSIDFLESYRNSGCGVS